MQNCTIFCNRKNEKRREPTNTGREPGLKGTGTERFKPPCPSPLPYLEKFNFIIPVFARRFERCCRCHSVSTYIKESL